jgi:DNA-binding NtrC family response regulator
VQQPRIIVVDPAGPAGLPYAHLLARLQPLEVRIEPALDAALASIRRDAWDLAVLAVRSSEPAGDLQALIREADPQLPMVVLDPRPDVAVARRCLQAGAADYVDLAAADQELEDACVRLLSGSRRKAAEEVLRRAVERPYSFAGFLGESPAMRAVYSIIERVAASSVDVLVTGETGTGKELVARAIHAGSRRSAGPFVPVDCGAIPDEVGELPLPLQAKLLRVLQERRVRRVGGRQENPVDVRVVAATSRPIDRMVEDGSFRRDLFYRINVVRIDLPPLRARGDDIGLLAEHFANRAAQETGRPIGGLSTDVYQVLKSYHWPGNVRELQNVVRRAIALTRSPNAGIDDLPDEIVTAAGRATAAEAGAVGFFARRAEHVAAFEREFLTDLLTRHSGDVSAAAREARLPRGTLYRLLKGHAIDAAAFRKPS